MSASIFFNSPKYPIQCSTITVSGKGFNGVNVAPMIIHSPVMVDNLYVERSKYCDNPGNITPSTNLVINNLTANIANVGKINVKDYIDVTSNLSVGTNAVITGNIQVHNITAANVNPVNINNSGVIATHNLNASGNISAIRYTSTVSNVSPFIVSSTVRVSNLNSATSGTSDITLGLKSATTTVNVSSAIAPTLGQQLVATSSTTATWQDPTSPTGNIVATSLKVNSVTSNSLVLAQSLTGAAHINISGYINSQANISATGAITSASLLATANVSANNLNATAHISGATLGVSGAITGASVASSGNISGTHILASSKIISTLSTGTAPLDVASTTLVPNLYVAQSVLSDTSTAAFGLKTGSTTVSISSATAPTNGQVLTASSSTLATWANPVISGNTISESSSVISTLTNASPNNLTPTSNWIQIVSGRAQILPGPGTVLGQTFLFVNNRLVNVQNSDVYYHDGSLLGQVPGNYSYVATCLVAGGTSTGSWGIVQLTYGGTIA